MNILLIVQSKIQNVDQFCNFGHFAVTCREPAFGAPKWVCPVTEVNMLKLLGRKC